ncbi:MAG: metal ABC transporter permease [Alphaproteobacteria bacterium]|nr:metal ABC transporter permease [Alphaproteobacteria bacterium]
MIETALVFVPALAAAALVAATHVPLGREVLRAGIVFLDLAIAQAAGFGVILIGVRFDVGSGAPLLQVGAAAAALMAAAVLAWTEARVGVLQEAVIGSAFVLAASAALLALSSNPHAGEHLQDLLVGQVLWTTWSALLPVAILYGLVLGRWWWRRGRLSRFEFYALFALTVTASVQLVGVYLVFATLILPAIAAHGLAGRIGTWVAYGTAVAGYFAGFLVAISADLPAGPVVVFALAGVALVARLARRQGTARSS